MVSRIRPPGRADDDQRRGFGADGGLEWLGAVGLRQRGLARPGTAQGDPLVDQQVVAAVDDEGAGRELHHLARRAGIDGGLDLGRVIQRSPRGVSLEQTVDRTGMPPTPLIPGFQAVARSAGRKALGSMLPGGDTTGCPLPDLVWSATPAATMV